MKSRKAVLASTLLSTFLAKNNALKEFSADALHGFPNVIQSRFRCDQQLIYGNNCYLIGYVPHCFKNLSYITNSLKYLRPSMIMLGDYNNQFLENKLYPNCKTLLARKFVSMQAQTKVVRPDSLVYKVLQDGSKELLFLNTVGYMSTQIQDSSVEALKPSNEQLVLGALTSGIDLFHVHQQVMRLLNLQSSELFTQERWFSELYQFSAKRLFSHNLFAPQAFQFADALRRNCKKRKPLLILQEDMLQRVVQILEKDLKPQSNGVKIDQPNLQRDIAICSLLFRFDPSRQANQSWIKKLTDPVKVNNWARQLQEKAKDDLYTREDPPPTYTKLLSTEETVSNAIDRFRKEQLYLVETSRQTYERELRMISTVNKVISSLKLRGLQQQIGQIIDCLQKRYTLRNIQLFLREVVAYAAANDIDLGLPLQLTKAFSQTIKSLPAEDSNSKLEKLQSQNIQELSALGYETLGWFDSEGKSGKQLPEQVKK